MGICIFGLVMAVFMYAITLFLKGNGWRKQVFGVKALLYILVILFSFFSVLWGNEKNVTDCALAAAVIMASVFEMATNMEEFIKNKTGANQETVKDKSTFNRNKLWYILLIILSSFYVIVNYEEIGNLKQLDVSAIIFVVWIMLLIWPLVSSVQIGSVRLSKKLDDMQQYTKDAISDIKLQMMDIKFSNSSTVIVSQTQLPSDRKMDDLENKIEETSKGDRYEENDISEISEDSVYLLKVRYKINQLLGELSDNYDYAGQRMVSSMLKFLAKHEVLSTEQIDLIKNVNSICNRNAHGEDVAEKYVDFVRKVMPAIIEQLNNEIKSKVNYHICSRCGYMGPSKFENYCPQCGKVTCE